MSRTRAAGPAATVVLSLALTLSACSDDADDAANEPSDAVATAGTPADATAGAEDGDALRTVEVVDGLVSPWGLVQLADGAVLVGERDTARILRVDGRMPIPLTTLPGVSARGEAGLLGLATTPEQDRVLAYYSTEDDNRIVAMTWDGTVLGEPEVLVSGIPGGAGYHQGGRLLLGPDDLLYVSTGDNGSPDSAQDPDSLSGKVLRFTTDGEPAPGNPFDSAVYSLGHRNIEGLAFDDRGRLWASEFGQDTWDELNLIEAGGNYGWPEVEGSGGGEDYLDPAVVWRTEDASPAGLAFWDGSLWMAALRGRTLWEVPLTADDKADSAGEAGVGEPVAHLEGELGRLRTVATTLDGDGLLLTTSNTDGRGDPADGDDRLLRLGR
ncbi:PQQ-dependent sugar dehydrogenase [Nocardioides sp.]|uniref:PQQ-dependent sugar dehydrogenase n=1 Tax=Nocardioides sp. TaxID=35761 RepID=UPI00286BB0E5|nr:PQQ-dependent sugar dehydrogenase [Nocardioides sp.]